MAAANRNNPAEVAFSVCMGAAIDVFLREHERAEILAARALELSEKHRMLQFAEYTRCILGRVRAELGRPSEGVALIRQGIAGLAAIGTHQDVFILILAESQALSAPLATRLKRSNKSSSQIVLAPT